MPIINIAPAVREGAHLVTALVGKSGSGKTLTALLMARGLAGPGGKIGFLDTETGRGRLYAKNEQFPEIGEYHYGELTPPFSPDRYCQAIEDFEKAQVDVLIIDSGSHEWEGIGGVLELKEASTAKNDMAKWAYPKAQHKRFLNRLLKARMHIIICLRARNKMKEATDPETGRKGWVSDGVHEIQEKDFIYEMTVSLMMRDGGYSEFIKCPAPLKPAFPAEKLVGVASGEYLANWVRSGKPVDHTQQDLKQLSEETAAKGTAELEKWWKTITKEERQRLAGYLDNLKSIAAEADVVAARSREGEADAGEPGPDLTKPFGQRGGPGAGSGAPTNTGNAGQGAAPDPNSWLISASLFGTAEKFIGEFNRQLADVVETPADVNALLTDNLAQLSDLTRDDRKMLEDAARKRRDALAPADKRSA